MARDLQNILSGGQITGIKLNGTGTEHSVPARGYIDGLMLGKADTTYVDAEVAKKADQSSVDEKASRQYVDNSVINTYMGLTVPDPALGNTGDRYHRYAADTQEVIKADGSAQNYDSSYFNLFEDNNALVGPTYIAVEPHSRALYIDYWYRPMPPYHDFTLTLNGTTYPLTVNSSTAGGVTLNYPVNADADIQSIVAGTQFVVSGSILSGVDEDYTKFDNRWYYTPIMNRTYDFVGATDHLITGDTSWHRVLQLALAARDAGVYEVKFSYTFTYDSVQRSAFFRWSVDGGSTWEVYSLEPKDKTDVRAVTYEFPWNFPGGAVDIILEGQCENSSDELNVKFANIVMERKA